MKSLFTDWVDLLWTPQITFIKRHWVFYILWILASVLYSVCIVYPSFISDTFDKIKYSLKKVFSRRSTEIEA